jgi:HSP20 family molecular chaperone IbpA
MKLPVEGYKPEEIEVRISNSLVTIEGKQEMRQENNFSSKSFSKKYFLK